MRWSDITVSQFQDIHRLSLDTDLDDMDKVTRSIAILFNKTENEVDNMAMYEFSNLAKQCNFLFTDTIPGKPEKYISIGSKKYGIQYDPKKLTHRQYVEVIHFSEKPIENMHLIMASLVQPVRFGLWRKNKASDHEKIAHDMLNARVIDVYHSCVFFCKLYANLIGVIRGSLVSEMMMKGLTKDQSESLVSHSQNAMDGFIQPEKWQLLKD